MSETPSRIERDVEIESAGELGMLNDASVSTKDLLLAARDSVRDLRARHDAVCDALDDACTLLEGWISKHCHPRYVREHMNDVAKKRAILARARGES